ncbi:MAG: hypothetical protein RL492_1767 [Verrucomicrobiota bacterium]|jgi:hypothetical protein
MADLAHRLLMETKAAEALKADLAALTDDVDAIRDTLEGETNLRELVRDVLLSIEEDQLLMDGCKARISDLEAREARLEKRIETKRALIEKALMVGDIPSVETDIGTVSLSAKPRALIIKDEAVIPSEFWKAAPPKLDKNAIKSAIRDGREVPGAELDNGGVIMTLRRK